VLVIAAIPVAVLLHKPPAVVSDSDTDVPWQIGATPVIAPITGVILIVTGSVADARHPESEIAV
jgi:hypothetical protein